MPLFRCLIRGDDFPGSLLGQKNPVGFYATRFVEADSPKEAEMLALDLLRNDPTLDVAPDQRVQSASIFFESIEEVSIGTERTPNKGFTFFEMETQPSKEQQ